MQNIYKDTSGEFTPVETPFFSALGESRAAFKKQFGRDVELTGGATKMHMRPALGGEAVDIRSRDLTPDQSDWLQKDLGARGMKVLKASGQESWATGPHIHTQAAQGVGETYRDTSDEFSPVQAGAPIKEQGVVSSPLVSPIKIDQSHFTEAPKITQQPQGVTIPRAAFQQTPGGNITNAVRPPTPTSTFDTAFKRRRAGLTPPPIDKAARLKGWVTEQNRALQAPPPKPFRHPTIGVETNEAAALDDYHKSLSEIRPEYRAEAAREIARERPLTPEERRILMPSPTDPRAIVTEKIGQGLATLAEGAASTVGPAVEYGGLLLGEVPNIPGMTSQGTRNLGRDIAGAGKELSNRAEVTGRVFGLSPGLPADVVRAGGSSLPFVPLGAFGAMGRVATGLLGWAVNAGQVYDEAREKGLSHEQALTAAHEGGPAGLLEMWGIGGTLDRIGRRALVNHFILATLREAGEEATQEMAEQVLNNLVAHKYYDPSRDMMTGVGYSGLVAAITGGVMGGGSHAVARVARQTPQTPQPRAARQPVEQIVAEPITPETPIQAQPVPVPTGGLIPAARPTTPSVGLTPEEAAAQLGAKEPTEPEMSDTIDAQIDALLREAAKPLDQRTRTAVVITPGEEMPARDLEAEGLITTDVPRIGTFIHPQDVSPEQIRAAAREGRHAELLGITAPRPGPGEPSVTVAARNPESGLEIQVAEVAPEAATKQAAALAAQHPDAQIGVEQDDRVLAERAARRVAARAEDEGPIEPSDADLDSLTRDVIADVEGTVGEPSALPSGLVAKGETYRDTSGDFEPVSRAAETAPTKETWQMTPDEFIEYGTARRNEAAAQYWELERAIERARKFGDGKKAGELRDRQNRLEVQELSTEKTESRYLRDQHRAEVERALERGDAVPPEALAEYPDLAKQYANIPTQGKVEPTEPAKVVSAKLADKVARKQARTVAAEGQKSEIQGKRADLIAEWKKKLGTQVSSGVDPEHVGFAVRILKTYIDEGVVDFKVAAQNFQDDFGEGARSLDKYLEAAWQKLKERFYPNLSDAGPVVDFLASKSQTTAQKEAASEQPTAYEDTTGEFTPVSTPEIQRVGPAAAEHLGESGEESLARVPAEPVQRTEHGGPVEPGVSGRAGEREGQVRDVGRTGERPAGREGAGAEGVHPARPGGRGTGTEPGRGRGQRSGAKLGSEQLVDGDRSPEEKRDDTTRAQTKSLASDFIATSPEQIGAGGVKTKYRNNILAIKTLRQIQAEGRTIATPEEQETLARFVGWGMFPQLFKRFESHYRQQQGLAYYEGTEEIKAEKEKWQAEAEEFRALMTDEEYDSAERSTLNAHYTSPQIVQAMWQMADKMGFKGGRLIEPGMGVGNFFAMMPAEMRGRSKLTGVELDLITGAMAKLLYPNFNIQVKGYQDLRVPDDFYDFAISNVPFGDYHVYDRDYDRVIPRAPIHDYYFVKTLDKIRAGGLMMFITSSHTMDKGDSRVRELIQKKADLVMSLRFPDGAFEKNAGTAVVTDMIVLRKRAPEAKAGGPGWLKLGSVPDPDGGAAIPINEYYVANPKNVLGIVDRKSRMYGKGDPHVSSTPDLWTRMLDAIERTPENVYKKAPKATARTFEPQRIEASNELKEGSLTVKDDKIWRKEGDHLVEQKSPARTIKESETNYRNRLADLRARVSGMADLRTQVREVFNSQLAGAEEAEKEAARRDLNKTYDRFVKDHGYLHEAKNARLFAEDPDAPTLLALEDWNPKTKKGKKRDIFRQDVITHAASPESATDVSHALSISLAEMGGIDLDRMSALLGDAPENITPELVEKGLAYNDPKLGWLTASDYLSGNVRRKLYEAREAALADEQYKPNVDALGKVQPEDVGYDKIYVRLGAPWLSTEDIQSFAQSLMGGSASDFRIGYIESSGQWVAHYAESGARRHGDSSASTKLYGTERAPFMTILQNALDGRLVQIYDIVEGDTPGSTRREFNKEESEKANAKIQLIREKFAAWVWTNDERRARLHRTYNDTFNNIRNAAFEGSHLTIDENHSVLRGMNPGISLRTHQIDAIWRTVSNGRSLYNHEVGTGKTYTMIGAAMELRRMGLAKKPAIAALKANVEDISAAARTLYPGIKLISIEGQFQKAQRRKTISRVATGDYDLVILTHDNLNQLPMSAANEARFVKMELDELITVLQAAEEADSEADTSSYGRGKKQESRLVKQLRKQKERLEARLKKAVDSANKDTNVTFEETGIDALFVDEAHMYKSLPIYTRLERIKGIPTNYSQRATNMLMRTRWLLEQNGNRGVTFATGTPVANTIAELFNVQRYLQWQELVERGIQSFDAWAKNFTVEASKMTMHFTGDYAPETRLDEFINIPDLQQLTQQIIDTKQTQDLPQIVRPDRNDAAHTSPMSRQQRAYMMTLRARMEAIKARRRPPQKGDDIPLTVNTDARKMSVDIRLVLPKGTDYPDSKVNRLIQNVADTLKAHPGSTQLIFSDIGVRPTKWGFRLYDDIISKLVKAGIPRSNIIDFANFPNSDAGKAAKANAMERLRTGDATIGIGSTQKLGTGVNVQDKLIAIHHLDSQYVPANVEQRNGRVWRQGNEHKQIHINTYVTAGSIDARLWSIVGRKTTMIKQFLKGDATVRTFKTEAGDELPPEMISAIASGNPLLVEKIQLDEDLRQLEGAAKRHENQQYAYKDTAAKLRRQLKDAQERVTIGNEDKATFDKNKDKPFSLTVLQTGANMTEGQQTFVNEVEAARALQKASEQANRHPRKDYQEIKLGEYRGFDIYRQAGNDGTKVLQGSDTYSFNFTWKKVPVLDDEGKQVIETETGQLLKKEFKHRQAKPAGSWLSLPEGYEVVEEEKIGGDTYVKYKWRVPKETTVLDEAGTIERLNSALAGWNGIEDRLKSATAFLDTESVGVKKIEAEIGTPFKDRAALESLRKRTAELSDRVAAGEGQESGDASGPAYIGDKLRYAGQTWVLMEAGKYPAAISMNDGSRHQWNSVEEFERQTGRVLGQDEDSEAIPLHSLDATPIEDEILLGEGDEGADEAETTGRTYKDVSGEFSAAKEPGGETLGMPETPARRPQAAELSDPISDDTEDIHDLETLAASRGIRMMMSQSAQPGFAGGKVSSTHVIQAYEKVLKAAGREVPVRTGRIAQRSAAGIFKVEPEVIRLRTANNIPTAAHETGHALQKAIYGAVKYSRMKTWPTPVKREMAKLGKALYGSTKPSGGYTVEGFAEFMRYYLTEDNVAQVAPETLQWFEGTVLPTVPRIAAALEAAREVTDTYRHEGAEARARANIERGPTLRGKIAEGWRALRHVPTYLIDEFTPLLKVSQAAEKQLGNRLQPEADPFQVASFLRGSAPAVTHYMVFDGMLDFARNRTGPGLQEIGAIVKPNQREDFTAYLWARRAQERWAQGKNPGMTSEDANYLVAALGTPEFQMAAQKVYDWNDGILSYVRDAVPDLAQSIDAIRRRSHNYVPLARAFDEVDPGTVARLNRVGSPLKRMTGSGRRVKDIFPQMIANAEGMIQMAHRRRVMDTILRIADIEGMGHIIEEVPLDKVPQTQEIERIAKQLEAAGADLSAVNLDALITFFTPAQFPRGQDPIIPAMKNGQMRWYQVSPDLYRTLSGLDMYRLPKALDLILGKPTRMFRLGTTGLRPAFSLFTNPARDVQTFIAQTKSHANPARLAAEYTVALGESLNPARAVGKGTQMLDAFYRLGVNLAQPLGQDIAVTRRAAKGLFHGRTMRIVRSPIDALREVLSATEAAPRVAEIRLLANEVGWDGHSPMTFDQAVQLGLAGKQVTVDFTAAGKAGKVVNQIVPFFNASIQGGRGFARTMRDRPTRSILTGLVALTLPTLALWYKHKDEDWYKDMPDREKFGYWHFPVGDQVLQFPRAFEWGNLFAVVPEAIFDSWYRKDPEGLKAAVGHIFETTAPDVLPHVIQVAREQWENKVSFTGRPIVPRSELDTPLGEQKGEYTSKLAGTLGRLFPNTVSPRRVDHLIRSILGGTGSDFVQAVEEVTGARARSREFELSDLPAVGRAFRHGGTMGTQSKAIERFYRELSRVQTRAESQSQPETEEERAYRLNLGDAQEAIKYLRKRNEQLRSQQERRAGIALMHEVASDALARRNVRPVRPIRPSPRREHTPRLLKEREPIIERMR
jgi:N12 class adenine-specific DNA methylase